MTTTSSNSNRSIRVFLSSTFKDFQEERDLLVRHVFPALRRKLSDRFVELVDVDLRWGITAQQAEQGQTLPICLVEIDRARPFFIGMLGERYGWVPPKDAYSSQLLIEHEWLNDHFGDKSVTELEILHGVLNNPNMTDRAFFYFRSASYSLSKGSDYLPSSKQEAKLQKALKARIKQSPFPVINYRTPQSFAKRLEKDLWQIINQTFPADAVPDAQSRERIKHDVYANSRKYLYLGGQQHIDAIEKAIANQEQRILIEGATGAGKSALIANWVDSHLIQNPNDLVYVHYLAASADSADPFALVFRLVEIIKQTTHSDEIITNSLNDLFESIPKWLSIASDYASQHNINWFFVFDALNNLTSFRDLRWFPDFVPSRIHWIVSCLPSDVCDTLVTKGSWCSHFVSPLTSTQKHDLLISYLKRYNKTLSDGLIEKTLDHPLTNNPLFLKTLAEELRLFGQHDYLEEQLNKYLTSNTIDELFEHVLQRVENDCGEPFVKQTLQTIWASRSGLNEKEILGINELPPSTLATIRNALNESLLESNGRINFSHDYLRLAIEKRYLNSLSEKQIIHNKMASWFQHHPDIYRRNEETPYQWLCSSDWINLHKFLTNKNTFDIFDYLNDFDSDAYKLKLLYYWNAVEENTKFTIDGSYTDSWLKWIKISNHNDIKRLVISLQRFLTFTGCYSDFNLELAKLSVDITNNSETSLNNLAHLYWNQGKLEIAENLFRQLLAKADFRLKNQSTDMGEYANNLGTVLGDMGRYTEAEQLLRRSLSISEKYLGLSHPKTQIRLNNLAENLRHQGNYEESEVINRRALTLAEQIFGYDHPETAITLTNLALVLYNKGEHELAESYGKRALKIKEHSLGLYHPDLTYTIDILAQIYHDKEEYNVAEQFYRRALSICESKLGLIHFHTATAVNNLATCLLDTEHYDEAEHLYRRAIDIVESTTGSNPQLLIVYLKGLGDTFFEKNDFNQSETYYRRIIELIKINPSLKLDNLVDVIRNLGISVFEKDDYESAILFFQEALQISEELNGPDDNDSRDIQFKLAKFLIATGDFLNAEALLRKELASCQKFLGSDSPETLSHLHYFGIFLSDLNRYDEAEQVLTELISLRENTKDDEDLELLAFSLCSLAETLIKKTCFNEAISAYQRALSIMLENFGTNHPGAIDIQSNIDELVQKQSH